MSSEKEKEEGVVTFCDGDDVDVVVEGTTKLIIDKSVKNVPEGRVDGYNSKSSFPAYGSIKEIIIEEGVKSIGKFSFAEFTNLETIIFPSTLKEIKEGAFYRCFELIVVNFLSNDTKIHKEAFMGCDALPPFMYKNKIKTSTETTENQVSEISKRLVVEKDVEENQYEHNDTIRIVEVKKGVKTIGSSAFNGCISLESITLPQSLREVGIGVFKDCKSLQEINIPKNVTVISDGLFNGCSSLKKVELSTSTTKIDYEAFENCISLENIKLPQTLEVIEDEAFANCKSLKKIEIPKSVKELGSGTGVDRNSEMKKSMPSDVTETENSLGDGVFVGCTSLEQLTFENDSELKLIETKTFYHCSSLKVIELPSSVTEIKDHAFSGCSSLKYINIHDNITTIGEEAFSGCTSLENISIPSSQTLIHESTFKNCTSLTSLTIPRSVKRIEMDAFRGCNSLREVTIQNPDIEIEGGAFAGCGALEIMRGLPSSEENIKSYLDRKVFKGCLSLENPIGNEIHLAAEGKCWKGDRFPQDGLLWIQQALEEKNVERKVALEENLEDDATFIKDYNGNTAFECAVRGGAPESYLKVLAQGKDKNGKTHLDIFADEYARKQPEDFTADELAFLTEINSKLLAATPIGEGSHYADSFEQLLNSTICDPCTEPEFIENLNKEFETRVFASIIMMDIFIPIMRIVAFSKISDVYFDKEKVGHANIGWFVVMYISIAYLYIRELYHFKKVKGFMAYFTDYWNSYDFSLIPLALISTTMMLFEELKEEKWMKDFIVAMTFIIWMFAILKTKMLSVQFAIFVSGVINIIWKLVPFFFVTFLVLGTFAQMYFINNRDGDFSSFTQAFLRTYSSLLAFDGLPFLDDIAVFFESANASVVFDEEDSTDWTELKISSVFGFLVVILLLNVLIAVLSTAWEGATERGRDDFLLYRIRLFLEVHNILPLMKKYVKGDDDSNSKRDKETYWSLLPDANYNKMWGTDTKFSDVLCRIKTECLSLIGRIVLNIIYTVLGIFFGLTWPTAVRRALFCIDNSEAITDKRNRLQTRLNETEEELERLDKIDKHITMKPDDMYAYLIDCNGIPSHFELKEKIGELEKQIKKQKKDVGNFKNWEDRLKGVHKEKKD